MKKPISIILGLVSMFYSYGQNISDAIRYTSETTLGTARFNSMSGAFGALGGDLSAVSVNPAGSAIFETSHISLSASNINTSNKAEFGSSSNSQKINKGSLDMNQVGAVFVLKIETTIQSIIRLQQVFFVSNFKTITTNFLLQE